MFMFVLNVWAYVIAVLSSLCHHMLMLMSSVKTKIGLMKHLEAEVKIFKLRI